MLHTVVEVESFADGGVLISKKYKNEFDQILEASFVRLTEPELREVAAELVSRIAHPIVYSTTVPTPPLAVPLPPSVPLPAPHEPIGTSIPQFSEPSVTITSSKSVPCHDASLDDGRKSDWT